MPLSTAAPGSVLFGGTTFDAVLFDMDGTLISSLASVMRSWTRLAHEFAIDDVRVREFRFHGVPARDIVDTLLAAREPEERARALRRIVELEVTDTGDIEVLPGAAEALAALAGTGRSAIVTSCDRTLASARLAATGLAVPEVVVTADDVARGKPDPEPYVLGAQRLGVDPARCLVVEDAAAGLDSGRDAGAATLALATQSHGDALTADVVVPDLGAVRFEVSGAGVRVLAA
ncbi:HAD-IA family hydrolase [Cellulomonas cellasea]|uniref:Sugar-phosphatase n=1 Tax=Cellulomonas cellasea TaxID=43670 RepID=A0A7W4UIA9_9CELL|nr:HAD-IA family hydrolase [Cellulomonas cellasea]MBB2924692.1 sugar-phosphatase [Cellulomonas cellasea]